MSFRQQTSTSNFDYNEFYQITINVSDDWKYFRKNTGKSSLKNNGKFKL